MRDINKSIAAADDIIKKYPNKDITIKEISSILEKSGYKQDKDFNKVVYAYKLGLYVGFNAR
ncbi:hypothetical protein [Eubacterium sp.]|uniref:hypothetical protein n=1 Tax=Eubacterium sp. TaxID=142586 RepID=UPI0025F8E5F9|nr:hypothetical protein [Eubacterium sp.]MCR5629826.1 hypothetical protein [Eubacterium sp.]